MRRRRKSERRIAKQVLEPVLSLFGVRLFYALTALPTFISFAGESITAVDPKHSKKRRSEPSSDVQPSLDKPIQLKQEKSRAVGREAVTIPEPEKQLMKSSIGAGKQQKRNPAKQRTSLEEKSTKKQKIAPAKPSARQGNEGAGVQPAVGEQGSADQPLPLPKAAPVKVRAHGRLWSIY